MTHLTNSNFCKPYKQFYDHSIPHPHDDDDDDDEEDDVSVVENATATIQTHQKNPSFGQIKSLVMCMSFVVGTSSAQRVHILSLYSTHCYIRV